MTPQVLYLLIPCHNEAATLATVLSELPATVNGLTVKILVADDGSADASAAIAESCGAEVLALERMGLAQTFRAGLREAIARDASYVISLDADGQYDPSAIPAILAHLQADTDLLLVERGKTFYQPMRRARRFGHTLGRFATRLTTGLELTDPVSGYRGYSRRAAQHLVIDSTYTYTLETLVQVIPLGLRFKTMTVAPRVTTRPSRLFKHPLVYVLKQGRTLFRSTLIHRPPGAIRLSIELASSCRAWLTKRNRNRHLEPR